jgi:hypothetical protein
MSRWHAATVRPRPRVTAGASTEEVDEGKTGPVTGQKRR